MVDLVAKEIYRSYEYLLQQDYLFESSMEVIAKHFLKNYFEISDIFNLTFENILIEFNKVNFLNKIRFSTEEEFFEEISKNYIRLDHEPRKFYSRYISEALENLRALDDNLNYCNYEIKSIENNENKDHYYIRKMKYFIQINQEQKDSIIKFLTYDVKERSLNDSRTNSRRFTSIMDYPYKFSIFPSIYDPKMSHNIEVKFGQLSIQEFNDVICLYRDNNHEYYSFINKYINENNICENILNSIKDHYYLINKISILKSAINSYNSGDFLVFINLATIQIEGLFHEYCNIIGIEVENKEYTFVEKIEKIKSKMFFYGYEYFAFDFPKLRNKVAHGRLIQTSDILNIANELILDLYYLTSIFNDITLPINTMVNTFNDFTTENPNPGQIAEYLLKGTENSILFNYLLDKSHDELIEFYTLREKRENIKDFLIKDDVWNELIKMIGQYNTFCYYDEFNNKIETIRRIFINSMPHKHQGIKLKRTLTQIKQKYNIK